jgi:hypothetical protein
MAATVTPPATIRVQVGSTAQPKVSTLSYGGVFALKSATDLSLQSHANGSSIIYNAATNDFTLGQPTAVVTAVDAGRF